MKKPFTWEHGPFEECWRCKGKETFGVLSIGGDRVTKRCTNCRYSHSEQLPKLDKKVIYLGRVDKRDSQISQVLIHMWTPPWQGPFVGMGLIGCFHMSGLFVQHFYCRWP